MGWTVTQTFRLCLCPYVSRAHRNTNLKSTSHFLNLPIFIQLCHAQSSASTSTNRADNQQPREQRVYHLSVLLFPPPRPHDSARVIYYRRAILFLKKCGWLNRIMSLVFILNHIAEHGSFEKLNIAGNG